MTTSNTYAFNPSLGDLGLTAFGRIGIRPTELTAEHMRELRQAANLTLSEWSNLQPNLWEVGLTSTTLVAGTATYTVNANIVMILDLYISTGTPAVDRVLLPISRSDYASYSNKTQQGYPNVFWFNRLTTPTLTFWPVPDSATTYTLNYYAVRQTQDSELANGQNVEIPYRHLEAFVACLTWKLSEIFRPEIAKDKQVLCERAWGIAAGNDVENVPLTVIPDVSEYFR